MNKFRNEVEIQLGEEKILLRPTFENIAEMEGDLGAVTFLAWKFSRGVKTKNGVVDKDSLVSMEAIRAMPSMTEIAKIVYYNQALKNPDGSRKFSLEEIWEKVQARGAGLGTQVIIYLSKITAGDNFSAPVKVENAEEETQKKS